MIAPELVEQQPSTRHCRRCDVEINAASARCPFCGARQYRRAPILGWRGALVCLVAVAAAVIVTRQVVESHDSPASYDYYRSSNIAVLVPQGYRDLFLAAPHGTAIAGFASSAHTRDTETVKAALPARGTPASRLAALARRLRDTPGVALSFLGVTSVVFPGGLRVPSLYFTYNGAANAVFTFDACRHTIAVTISLTAAKRRLLSDLSAVVPQSANAICDGPDFSAQDRADTAIPLALPS
jgi:hypothetical protein